MFYTVEFVYNGFLCNVNSPLKLHFVWLRWHLLYEFQFSYNANPAITFFMQSSRGAVIGKCVVTLLVNSRGWSSLRVVFSQTGNFTVIAFTDANMYATSMTQRNVLKARVLDHMVWLPKLAKKIYHLNTLHIYPAKTNKDSKTNKGRVTEFLYQALELRRPIVRFLQKTRAWSRSKSL